MERLAFLHGAHTPKCDARIDKYFDGYYTLQFSRRGPVEVLYDGIGTLLHGPWFWPAFPGPRIQFHAGPGEKTWDHYYIAVRGALAMEWMAEGIFPTAPQSCPARYRPEPIYLEIYRLAFSHARLDRLQAIHLLEGILLELARNRLDSQQPAWLTTLLAKLENAPVLWPDYDALARTCGLSLIHLRRLFAAATGQTLHDYILQLRMTRARDLLAQIDVPIKEVAARLGYEDVYYFTKQFRKIVGVPPAAYRRSFAGFSTTKSPGVAKQ